MDPVVDAVVPTVPLVGVLLIVLIFVFAVVVPLVDGLASALRSSTDELGLNLAPLIFGGLSEVADEGVSRTFGEGVAEAGVGIWELGDSGLCEL